MDSETKEIINHIEDEIKEMSKNKVSKGLELGWGSLVMVVVTIASGIIGFYVNATTKISLLEKSVSTLENNIQKIELKLTNSSNKLSEVQQKILEISNDNDIMMQQQLNKIFEIDKKVKKCCKGD